MSEELNPSGNEDDKADKKCDQKKNTAKGNFEAVLQCIAGEAYKVNRERIDFLTGTSTPEKLRAAEKNLFNAIKVASKKKAKKQFESFVVELKYKEQGYIDPTTQNTYKTEVISAVRGLTFYHKDNDTLTTTGEESMKSDGEPIRVDYSSLSSSSAVQSYP